VNIKTIRGFVGLAGLAAAGLVLAGCGAAPTQPTTPVNPGTTSNPTDPTAGGGFLACAVSDEGNFKDKSFNEAAYGGLEQAQTDLGVEIQGLESQSMDRFEPNLTQLVDDGCGVIFAIGFNFSLGGTSGNGLIFDFADANADTKFAWLDGWPGGTAGNVKPIMYNTQESAYLAGYLSAAYSTTKVIGTYGGLQIDSVTVFMDGFYWGAQQWAEDNATPVTVLGWDPATASGDFVGGFEDTTIAGSISDNQIAQGADVILPVAGSLFTATAESIRSSGKDVVLLGVDKDIALTQPQLADITLTSVEKKMTQAVFDITKETMDGAYSVDPYIGTLANDGTGLSPFYEFDAKIPAELKTKLEELSAGIQSGDIDIPLTTNPV
jgi:basic membrane protein A